MNGGDCGSQTSRAARTVAPTLCRQPPGSANISGLHWAKGNLLKIIRPLPPAAVSCRTQSPAPNSVARAGAGHSAGPVLLDKPGAAEDPGPGFLVPVRFLLRQRDRWCCTLPMPRVAAGSAHHQQAGPTAAAQHRTPAAPFSPPFSRVSSQQQRNQKRRPCQLLQPGQEGGQRLAWSMCPRVTGIERPENCNIASLPPIHLRT